MKCPNEQCDHEFDESDFDEYDEDKGIPCPSCGLPVMALWNWTWDSDDGNDGDEWAYIESLEIIQQL